MLKIPLNKQGRMKNVLFVLSLVSNIKTIQMNVNRREKKILKEYSYHKAYS